MSFVLRGAIDDELDQLPAVSLAECPYRPLMAPLSPAVRPPHVTSTAELVKRTAPRRAVRCAPRGSATRRVRRENYRRHKTRRYARPAARHCDDDPIMKRTDGRTDGRRSVQSHDELQTTNTRDLREMELRYSLIDLSRMNPALPQSDTGTARLDRSSRENATPRPM